MVVLFLQTDLGGGGTGCQGRSPARTERRWWILISCGPATSRSRQYLHRTSRHPSPACAGCRDRECPAALFPVCREEADVQEDMLLRCPCLAGERLRLLRRAPAWHGPQTTEARARLHQRDHKAAAGRRCRCRFGPGFRCHPEPLTDGGRKVS